LQKTIKKTFDDGSNERYESQISQEKMNGSSTYEKKIILKHLKKQIEKLEQEENRKELSKRVSVKKAA